MVNSGLVDDYIEVNTDAVCAAIKDVFTDTRSIVEPAGALAVAAINVERHGMQARMRLVQSDGMNAPELQACGPFDLILCNPPYVNAQSMAELPQEYLAEPFLALDGNRHGSGDGMDFVRDLFKTVTTHMTANAVLVLEIGHERSYFEAAFPHLNAVWLDTSAGADQVLLLTLDALLSSQ